MTGMCACVRACVRAWGGREGGIRGEGRGVGEWGKVGERVHLVEEPRKPDSAVRKILFS